MAEVNIENNTSDFQDSPSKVDGMVQKDIWDIISESNPETEDENMNPQNEADPVENLFRPNSEKEPFSTSQISSSSDDILSFKTRKLIIDAEDSSSKSMRPPIETTSAKPPLNLNKVQVPSKWKQLTITASPKSHMVLEKSALINVTSPQNSGRSIEERLNNMSAETTGRITSLFKSLQDK